MRDLGFRAARLAFLGLFLLSGVYCLLAYNPFTYQAVLKFNMVSWLPTFIRWQPALTLGVVLLNATLDGVHRQGTALKRRVFYALLALAALALLFHPLLPRLENGLASFAYALAFLGSALALLLLDFTEQAPRLPPLRRDTDQGFRLLLAALGTALFLSVLFLSVARLKAGPGSVGLVMVLWSLGAHLLAALMGAVALLALQGLARSLRMDLGLELRFTLLAGTVAGAVILHQVAFTAIAFTGVPALIVSILLGLCLMLTVAVLGPGLRPPAEADSALELLLHPLAPLLRAPLWAVAAGLGALGTTTWLVQTNAALFDWNFLFQKLVALATAGLAFAAFHTLAPRWDPPRSGSNPLFLATLGAFLAFKVLPTLLPADLDARLERHAGQDASVRLLREVLAPADRALGSIYRILQRNSNIPQDVKTDPVDVDLVPELKRAPGPRPNIFILVVDSLRQDYLGAYNAKVTFTPAMDRFAKENVALPAFARYGATGLSEPSIWTGGMLLHKQYVTPFRPMNSLQKMLEADGYRSLISSDNVLDAILKPFPGFEELTPGLGTQDLRMCNVVPALNARLEARGSDSRPTFAYAQVQDLHVSVINREGKDVPGGGEYPGFYAPYASRVSRLDQCFGAFIDTLKAKGLYDESIVILTADHGDSLGEEGRFGHAYTLFPEILRVPMLIHLPASMKGKVAPDPAQLTFLTDLTPTLYYLLGHRPLASDPILGRPLFTETPQEHARYSRDHYLLASSYGAVYGILEGDGKGLYISDGVNLKDYYYDLGWDPGGTRNALTAARKRKYDDLILRDLRHLSEFYRFNHGIPSP
ncbi:MAG: sulfatase-like hydrolase/transferase [Acidobacteria bacterium]|nr:sulfatase-like hydrolase/transferase [Acidobacteriota bacterium]